MEPNREINHQAEERLTTFDITVRYTLYIDIYIYTVYITAYVFYRRARLYTGQER